MKSMSIIIRSLTLILPLAAVTAQAGSIYKCKQANGSVTYTSSACPEDTVTRENINKFTFYPPSSGNVSVGTLPDLEAQQLEQLTREREQREMVRRQETAAGKKAVKGDDRRI